MTTQGILPRILQLADTIHSSVANLHQILSSANAGFPSFHEDAQVSLPDEASDAQDAIFDATAELYDLLLDPIGLVRKYASVSAWWKRTKVIVN